MNQPKNTTEQQRLEQLRKVAGRKARRGSWNVLFRTGRLFLVGLVAFALAVLVFWAFLQWYSG